jgi:acyl-CoA thioester hydrolase
MRGMQLGQWKDGWFVVPYHVLFRDIDAFGHVNNAVFFTYFEWGRTQLWFEMSGGERGATDIGFIVARAECDFKKQIGLEPIEVWTRVGEMRNSSLDFETQIRLGDGSIAATGKVVVVFYDWARRTKISIPEEVRAKVTRLFGPSC